MAKCGRTACIEEIGSISEQVQEICSELALVGVILSLCVDIKKIPVSVPNKLFCRVLFKSMPKSVELLGLFLLVVFRIVSVRKPQAKYANSVILANDNY